MTRQSVKQNLRAVPSTARHLLLRPGFKLRKGLVVVTLHKRENDKHGKYGII